MGAIPSASSSKCLIFPWLVLHFLLCTEPAQHLKTADTECTVVDYLDHDLSDLHDLDRGLSGGDYLDRDLSDVDYLDHDLSDVDYIDHGMSDRRRWSRS